MFIAHINPENKKEQTVKDHLLNVAELAKQNGEKIKLGYTCELAGILHDMGKYTSEFNNYIHYSAEHPSDFSLKGRIDHSSAGASWLNNQYSDSKNQYQRLASQLISLAVCSHHGGIIDCINQKGIDKFSERMSGVKNNQNSFQMAFQNFKNEFDLNNIDKIFENSINEIKSVVEGILKTNNQYEAKFAFGLLTKYVFSCLVDADRLDTHNFMDKATRLNIVDKHKLWEELLEKLERNLDNFPDENKIDQLRKKVSETCKEYGDKETGIYQLSVPTGGGKTLSSLRYAVEHAKKYNKDRIIYIIPFTTIIDQNAIEIRKILDNNDIILEHHSNVININDEDEYKLVTDRWESPIILTTMVQFLNTFFTDGTSNIRRMHNLANSILIFDEIQAIPVKLIHLFNSTINFLTYTCNTTALLCTATQPLLSKTKIPIKLSKQANIMENMQDSFELIKRVNIHNKILNDGFDINQLSDFILQISNDEKSILVIVNTKKVAQDLYNHLKEIINNNQFLLYHLSTSMCPNNRIKILENLKEKLKTDKVICISTQLIEAGINISFTSVIRSIAGLDNIAQAAGRCNRHGEQPNLGNVYIVDIKEENLSKLPDIKVAQECTRRILNETSDKELLTPENMDRYYQYYFFNRQNEMNYSLRNLSMPVTIYDLLSDNKESVNAYNSRNAKLPGIILRQAFQTAGENFSVIEQNTTGVLVPYEKGEEIIIKLNGNCNIEEFNKIIKEAQQYSINLYEHEINKLNELGGIMKLNNGSILAIREKFYNAETGVLFERPVMDFCNV